MNLKELVGRALNSSDLAQHEYETAVDRVGALGRTTKLASALWRVGYGGDQTSLGSALRHLLRKAQRRTRVYKGSKDFPMLNRIGYLVLSEWLNPACRSCGGRQKLELNQEAAGSRATVVCHVCDGTGIHRYSDMERAHQLNIEIGAYRKVDKMVSDVWACLSGADVEGVYDCRFQLERSRWALNAG